METTIKINNNYNSLYKLLKFLKKDSNYEFTTPYDHWEIRTDANGQMEQCILIKKSAMHAVKLFFTDTNTVKVNYVIPNKLMHAYFGKIEKARRNIIEILAGIIKQSLLNTNQEKAFLELESVVKKAAI